MVKTQPINHGSSFNLSDIFGLTKERGDEIAGKLNELLAEASKKSHFIDAALNEIELQSDEEQAFMFVCIGQALQ